MDFEQQGLVCLKRPPWLQSGVGSDGEGKQKPSVREGNEGAVRRGAALEGGREVTAGLGQAYIPGDSCPSCLLPAEEGSQACFPSTDPTPTWGEDNPSKGAELLLLSAAQSVYAEPVRKFLLVYRPQL